jgi:hypothetical protein
MTRVAAILFVFAGSAFIAAACAYKLVRERVRSEDAASFEHRIRRYTDGVEVPFRGIPPAPARSERPLLRLLGIAASWLAVAAAAGIWLWSLLRPTRRTMAFVALSQLSLAIVFAIIFACLKPYHRERLWIFLDPTRDPLGSGFAALRVRERFIPRWPVTGAAATAMVAAALVGAGPMRLRRRRQLLRHLPIEKVVLGIV